MNLLCKGETPCESLTYMGLCKQLTEYKKVTPDICHPQTYSISVDFFL